MRRKLILLAVPVFFALVGYGQSTEVKDIRSSLSRINDSSHYVDALNRLAMLLYEKNIDSTFVYTSKARQIADRLSYAKGTADALNNLGVIFDIKGNLQLALRYYNEAYANYVKLRDSANQVQTLMNIAMVYKEIGKDKRAIQLFGKALDLGKHLRQDSIMSLTIYNYLLQYPGRFSRDSASIYIVKAQKIAAKYKDQRTLIAIDQLTADGLISHGNRKMGLKLLDSTINMAISKDLFYVSMDMIIDLGDNFSGTDSAKAVGYYKKGLTIASDNNYLFYRQLLNKKLFDFYSNRHDRLSAATYSSALVALNDIQENINNVSGIDYLDYAYKDQQVKALTIRSEYQTVMLALIAAVCILIVSVWLIGRNNLKKTRLLNTQVNEQNLQMKIALGALEQSQADNTRMMQIVAHDLRNPIGGITTIASMMLDNDARSEDDRVMLELIKTSGTNSLELVSDLLQVHTRAEELKKEPVDLDQMLHYCVDLLDGKASAKGQRLVLQSRPVSIAASPEKLWRVVSNLIANAIKFSPSGGVIEVNLEAGTEKAIISVKDHGIGIPEDLGAKIFDMFTPAKRPGTAGEQAFGLGLAISRQIVEIHGGRIWFESIQGEGTTFFVELPV